ncbi:MAG TPA: glycosyltransferase family 4 protein [Thermodesulfovibrionales bacterium]|nr:glycosyltransferase family 4 protein [Thermodesulfovibrionales bacterium]
MRICYLLESTELCGGVRVVFDQARALQKLGHRVTIRALRGDHLWYPYPVDVDYVSDLSAEFVRHEERQDIVIATFWTTVKPALRLSGRKRFHLCQGYEGDNREYADRKDLIEDSYKVPVPKLTVGDWLSKRLIDLFGSGGFAVHTIGQIVDLDLYRPLPFWKRWFSTERSGGTRVLVSGLFDASVKAIGDALQAVALLRESGIEVNLTRVSTSDTLTRENEITAVDEYLISVPPARMAAIYQASDLFIAPSLSHEGFGLPFGEALACGIPSVATAIPSHMSFDIDHDYACFVPEGDPPSIADAALNIMKDRDLRTRLRKRGIEVVRNKFRSDMVAARLESVFSEALKS